MAGRIPEQTVEEIRMRADIVEVIGGYLPLHKRGGDFWACCPFHNEKTPSFKVSSSHQTFYCFGCQKSGNVFSFVQERENVDFVGALRLLADRFGVKIPEPERNSPNDPAGTGPVVRKEMLLQLCKEAAAWFRRQLQENCGSYARDYLRERGIDEEPQEKFSIGYAPESWDALLQWAGNHGYETKLVVASGLVKANEDDPSRVYDRFRDRLMFPIHDELGRVVGFSGRILSNEKSQAKYINSPESAIFHKSKLLYGLHLARTEIKNAGGVLVCEGQLDVIACHRAGLKHAVAPQGTAFTPEQAMMLKRFTDKVILAFDADAAGQKAALRSIELALAEDLQVRVVCLPEGADPDSVFKESGAAGLHGLMSNDIDAFEFAADMAAAKFAEAGPEGRAQAAAEVLELLTHISSPVKQATRCQWLSGRFNVPERVLLSELQRLQNAKQRQLRYSNSGGQEIPAAVEIQLEKKTDPIYCAEAVLLDLAFNFGFIAHELTERLPSEAVSGSELGKALNMLIGMTAQGEWELARRQLKESNDNIQPEVIRVVMDSRYSGFDLHDKDEKERRILEKPLLQAMDDCLRRLRREQLKQQMQNIGQELKQTKDLSAGRELLQHFHNCRLELEKLGKKEEFALTNE